MAKVIRTTNRCPVCGYEYQVSRFFKDEERMVKKLSFKKENGKELLGTLEKIVVKTHYDQTGNIYKGYESKTEIIDEPVMMEVFDKEETTKGEKPFVKFKCSSFEQEIEEVPGDANCVGMFCPNCGVFLNTEICTTVSEEKIQ